MNELCSFGCGKKAIKQFKNGNYCCAEYVTKCPEHKKKNSVAHKGVIIKTKDGNHPRKNKAPWNKGLTKETNSSLTKSSNTLKKRFKTGDLEPSFKGQTHTKEAREKIRISINNRYANGWEVKCGRSPKIDYESPIAGKIKVDGSWELAVAKYLDSLNVVWRRNKKRFKYYNEIKKRESTYCPDFYIEDWNTYLEVKGYETDLDKCKWMQFTEPLIIWKKEDLINRNILT